ncbi:MAG: MFS transporter [Thermoplasmata archaeon]|nr:MFS transporter [Thermoplasmata archaeon]MVT12987.1 MFS transporter [Euryarchaeota archaeon]MVT14949.1 MFS transporter [Euryarchaeota archaeon]MVT35195.1 MFS transporter [Euryarchaeota archaeon]
MEKSNIIEEMDKVNVSKFHYKMLLLSAAGVFLDGYDLFIISVVLLFIKPIWINTLPPAERAIVTGAIAASALIGMFVGAFTLGHYTDKIGRKTMYVIDLIFFVVFAGLSAVSQNVYQLIIFRFLLGIGIGADYPISSTYISEFAPAEKRGRMISSTFTFWGIGALTAAIVGYFIALWNPLGNDSWRIMLLSGVIPAVIVILLRTTMPESPRWLLSQAKTDRALKIIKMLNPKINLENIDLNVKREKSSIRDLISPVYIRRTLFAWIPWFFMDIAVYGIGMYTPTILQALGFKDPIQSIIGTAILDTFGIIGFILAIIFIDRVGRLRLQILGFLGMGLSLLLLGLTNGSSILLLLVLFAIFQISENAGPNTTTWVVATELFPTRLRGTAQGSSAAISRVGAITGVFILPLITQIYGEYAAITVVSLAAFAGLIATLILGEETKSLSLEDASNVFREFSSYIRRISSNVKEAAKVLYEISIDFKGLEEKQKRIKELEHNNDEMLAEIFNRLNRKFPAPIDSFDIASLIRGLDDIIDSIEATSKKILIYGVDQTTNEIIALSEINLKAVSELEEALNQIMGIRLGEYSHIVEICRDIHKLENYADDIVDNVITHLVKNNDALHIIKYKEIYESLEKITDRCDDVADIIMSLIVKYT